MLLRVDGVSRVAPVAEAPVLHHLPEDGAGHACRARRQGSGAAARWALPSLAPATAAHVKCVVVDADYTLWHGAVGELGGDGPRAGALVECEHY